MTDHATITGQEDHVHDRLSGYLNGDLSESDLETVERHLADCSECRQDLASLRLTVAALRRLPSVPVPRDFSITSPVPRRVLIGPWLRVPIGALAAAFLVVLGYRLLFQAATNSTVPPAASVAPMARDVVSRPAAAPPLATPPAAAAPTNTPAPAAPVAPPPVATQPVASIASPRSPAAAVQSAKTATAAPAAAAPERAGLTASAPAPSAGGAVAPTPTEAAYTQPTGGAASRSTAAYPSPANLPAATIGTPYPESSPNGSSGFSTAGYPAPGVVTTASKPLDQSSYPSPIAPAQSADGGAGVNAATPVALDASTRTTTWFTPALGILAGLVLLTAIAFLVMGRRST